MLPRRADLAQRARALSVLPRRAQQALLPAAVTGVVTGAAVAAFERLTGEVLLAAVLDAPLGVQVAMPAAGLVVAVLVLRRVARGASPTTTDEYIRNFHEDGRRLDLAPVPGRLAAAVATLGSGGALGYEGPSIYAGAAIGSWLQRRRWRWLRMDEPKVLLVAGAAAGVAAIFKAPVTGLVFALEVPFQDDLARRMLLPAAISAGASYVTFAAFVGTDPLLPVAGQPPFDLVDLGGAALLGLGAGLLARVFVALIDRAKAVAVGSHPYRRAVAAGVVLALAALAAHALTDQNQTLGPGYDTLRWALDPDRGLLLLVAIGTLRVLATVATVGGGGTGGLFIPLVIQGALVGRFAAGVFGADETTLFPVLGIASFLGAGYRVPLAAVVFVAEFTGRPGFIVPGLIAAVVAELVMGRVSISPYQVAGRVGHLERRLRMSLAGLIDAEARTVPPDATLDELFWHHLVGTRQHTVAVVDGGQYLGLIRSADVAAVDRAEWATTTVDAVMRTDVPVHRPDDTVADAVRAMEDHDVDRVAVCDGTSYVGVVSAADIVRFDELIDRLGDR